MTCSVDDQSIGFSRRNLLRAISLGGASAAMGAMPIAPALAQLGKALSLGNVLGQASDNALDDLSQPGAFYADEAIRILMPGGRNGLLSKGLDLGSKLGLTGGLVRSLNDAAGIAAGEAKPIFRSAIDNISWQDVPGIIGKNDGATRYLRSSTGDQLNGKLHPLVDGALGKVGAFKQLDKIQSGNSLLGAVGISRGSLTDHVTKEALNGIFKYIGNEEGKLRANPLGAGKKLFDIF